MIVVDTNVLAYLIGGGPLSRAARAVLRRDAGWVAPRLWRSELRNALATKCRAGALQWDDAAALMEIAEQRMREGTIEVTTVHVLAFARRTGCTAYDSELGALAEELDVPLVTTDRGLLAAIPGRAVAPAAFLAMKQPP